MPIKPNELPILNLDVQMIHQEYLSLSRTVDQVQKEYNTVASDMVMDLFDDECEKEGLSRLRAIFEGIPWIKEEDWSPRMSITRIRGFLLTDNGWYKPDYTLDQKNFILKCDTNRADPQPDIPLDKINEILARITAQTGIKLDVRVWKILESPDSKA